MIEAPLESGLRKSDEGTDADLMSIYRGMNKNYFNKSCQLTLSSDQSSAAHSPYYGTLHSARFTGRSPDVPLIRNPCGEHRLANPTAQR